MNTYTSEKGHVYKFETPKFAPGDMVLAHVTTLGKKHKGKWFDPMRFEPAIVLTINTIWCHVGEGVFQGVHLFNVKFKHRNARSGLPLRLELKETGLRKIDNEVKKQIAA